jgi:hypothetical protein
MHYQKWSVGKTLDKIASLAGIRNTNNEPNQSQVSAVVPIVGFAYFLNA